MNHELLERFRAGTTEQLQRILASPEDYTEEARQAAEAALAERGVKFDQRPTPAPSQPVPPRTSTRGIREALVILLFFSLLWVPASSELLSDAPQIVRILARTLPTAALATAAWVFWNRESKK
jgi:hypothetical protein